MLLKRNRTSSKYIYYALHLYFSGLSLRRASEHLFPFIKRKGIMFRYGIGFNASNQKRYFRIREKYLNL
jgi:hypothetical protein